jgi:glycerophosphoryl diester phosphodiesterase
LDQVFALAKRGNFRFNIETKIEPDKPELAPDPETFVRLVLRVVRKHKLEHRVILQSFDFRTLRVMKRLAPEIPLSALTEESLSFVKIGREAGAQIVSPDYRWVTAARVRAAHRAGLQVLPWTANTPKAWRKLIAAGVDGIITDNPAALLAYLKR